MNADRPTIAERVAASRAAQGLPPTIEDPAILARIAAVFAAYSPPVPTGAGRRAPAVERMNTAGVVAAGDPPVGAVGSARRRRVRPT